MRYFVSYFFKDDTGWGIGNGFVTVDEPIETAEHVRDIGRAVCEEGGVLVTFIEVHDPPTEENTHPE